MRYTSEKQVKNALMQRLREHDAFVTPIQTRTIVGVPDLYVATKKMCFWVECKFIKATFNAQDMTSKYTIPFRPGQQLWALTHYVKTGVPVYCVVGFKNDIMVVPQTHIFHNHVVERKYFINQLNWALDLGIIGGENQK